ncbi:MAG: AAA family ATPase [Alphaproteobacteria bacterium]
MSQIASKARAASRIQAWLIDALVPRSATVCLTGNSEAGKRTLTLDLVEAVATGATWNGRSVRQGAVAYVLASGKVRTEERLRTLTDSAPQGTIHILKPIGLDLRGLTPGFLQFLKRLETLAAGDLSLIVIDSLLNVVKRGVDHPTDVEEVATALQLLARRTGAAVVVLHDQAVDGTLVGNSALPSAFQYILAGRHTRDGGPSAFTVAGPSGTVVLPLIEGVASASAAVELSFNSQKRLDLSAANDDAVDRRRFDRLPLSMNVLFDPDGRGLAARTLDLSEDGMLLTGKGLTGLDPTLCHQVLITGIGRCRVRVAAQTPLGTHCQFAGIDPRTRAALEDVLRREKDRCAERTRLVQDAAWTMAERIEQAIQDGSVALKSLFEPRYNKAIAGKPADAETATSKSSEILASYSSDVEPLIAPVIAQLIGAREDVVASAVVDRNAYAVVCASHKQPGPEARRMWCDPVSLKAARNNRPILIQDAQFGIGGLATPSGFDFSAPIRILGRHWGSLRVQYA